MLKDTHKTVVVFRKFKEGDIIALFPALIYYPGGYCESYQRVGQHGAADYSGLISVTKLADEAEYRSLKKELESFGYNLEVRKRFYRKAKMKSESEAS